MNDPEIGVLLPHFGADVSAHRVRSVAELADKLGFDSLWVRDHLYVPSEEDGHGGLSEDEFLEGLLVLATVSSVVDDIRLGTAVANPHRHPLKLSQQIGTLDRLNDGGVICGVGAGAFQKEFDAVDRPFEERWKMAEETLEILSRTFSECSVSYDGDLYSFEDVKLSPRASESTPIWYGGISPKAVERAVHFADGWIPHWLPLSVLDQRLSLLSDLEAKHGRKLDRACTVMFNVNESPNKAEEELHLDALVNTIDSYLPERIETVSDIEGSYIAGTPDDCIQRLEQLFDRGTDHVVLDMRHCFDSLERKLEITGNHVLPAL